MRLNNSTPSTGDAVGRSRIRWAIRIGTALLLAAVSSPARPPNVVLVVADDLGYGDLSSYGSKQNPTPHLDRLALDGIRLTRFYANGPVCTPTRGALLTGRYPQRSGTGDVFYVGSGDDQGLPPESITIAEAFKANGYATGIFGKWHLGEAPRFNPIVQGFDRFVGFLSGNIDYHSHGNAADVVQHDWWNGMAPLREPGYATNLIADHAMAFVREHRAEPFFLYLAMAAPHYPFQGPDDPAIRVIGEPIDGRRFGRYTEARYRAMIGAMDVAVGKLRALLDTLELSDHTIVLFISDNGAREEGSNGMLRGKKGELWEGGIRVPAMIAWPGTLPGTVASEQVALAMDWYPTLFGMAGLSLPAGWAVDGRDLSAALRDGKTIERETLFFGFREQRAVLDDDWKLVHNVDGQGRTALFDLSSDPGERNDRATDRKDLVERLTAQLKEWEGSVWGEP